MRPAASCVPALPPTPTHLHSPVTEAASESDRGLHRRFGDLVSRWAQHRWASGILFGISVGEPIVLSIPPDTLLWPMAYNRPRRSLLYAAIALIGCILGMVVSYGIGMLFTDLSSRFVGPERMDWAHDSLEKYGSGFLVVAGLAPIPFKFVIAACGVLRVNPAIVFGMCILGRALRFGIPAMLIERYGERARPLIDRYFTVFCVGICLLLVASVLISMTLVSRSA